MHFIGLLQLLYFKKLNTKTIIYCEGFAGSGAADGIAVAGYEVYGPMVFIILGYK